VIERSLADPGELGVLRQAPESLVDDAVDERVEP